jgi:hypothetical protein
MGVDRIMKTAAFSILSLSLSLSLGLSLVSLTFGGQLTAQPSIGGYNVYYGHLHNHCNVSDGLQTPDYAYNYAKTTGDLDFFSLSDHSSAITTAEWTAMKTAADKYNEPNVFTAFRGFEWTSSLLGHVAVINSTDYISTTAPANTFDGLCNWLNTNECIAFFNHPGRYNSTGLEFGNFSTTPTEKIVGMELWNKADRFDIYYYTDGYYTGDGNLGYYDEALTRGWKIGASGSEDNHSGTWGTMAQSKLAVLASANTRTEIMNALKARRFFTTYDKNLAVSFKIGGNEMGSTVVAGPYQVQIQLSDTDGEMISKIELIKNGLVLNTWKPNTSNPSILSSLLCAKNEYYYIRVLQADGDEAISSPIFISDNVSTSYTFSKRIAAGTDDAEEYSSGTLTLSSTALELVYASKSTGNQTVGLRFTGVNIPKGAIITKALIQFGTSQKSSSTCKLTVKGEYTGSSASFSTTKKDISNRLKTTNSVPWTVAGWTTTGAAGVSQQTPDLKAIVQDIIGHTNWVSGNNMAFIITGTGTRTAYAYEGSSSKAAQLYVEYNWTGGKSSASGSEKEIDNQMAKNQNQGNEFEFDFSTGYDGWSGDFADYPVTDSLFYELAFNRTTLPSPLNTNKHALMLRGANHSDDLFMFIKRKISGLSPNKTYKLTIDIELASEAPTNAGGIGGAPGESVYLKAGASLAEPKKTESSGFYHININKSNQAMPGHDMDTIGHIGVSDTTTAFTLITRNNSVHPFIISTNNEGTVWVCIGTDSGFEGTTTLYYNRIKLAFDNLTEKEEIEQDNDITLFPNPVKEALYISSKSDNIRGIEVFNLNGQLMTRIENSNTIKLKNFLPGVYFVRITGASNYIVTRKIIVD